MSFEGSCHCGAVSFTAEADAPTSAVSCNCSYCRRKGSLLAFLPAEAVTISADPARLKTYQFNKHRIEHQFCETCGTQAFAKAKRPDGAAMVAINLRCVPAIDLDALEIHKFDGAST
ncbi:GFA family protein [Labrys portucalensis]|uniref:GFA family protein n=1 Tax=Labrys neptuniae TaxID=376174 RepID=A0ABV6ZEV4_9HYPH|nr:MULTISPECIES: GFA family protein [Labrys]MDT3377262.1 GFA family protein [Labrys neptuniae]MDZ5452858.1 GFA family protein [Labrys sp. ZIDIC5]OCC01968.1 aldehyde-activating protein [Labrys sp. WJW]